MKRLIALAATLAALTTACAESGAQPLGPAPGNGSAVLVDLADGVHDAVPELHHPIPTRDDDLRALVQLRRIPVRHASDGAVHARGRSQGARGAAWTDPRPRSAPRRSATSINAGTRLLDLTIDDGVATVDLDATFIAEETPASRGRAASRRSSTRSPSSIRSRASCSRSTALPSRTSAATSSTAPSGGRTSPISCRSILVESPGIGERVSSPVTIAGTADVFEAVVSIAILDEHGDTVASTFTMATCGTGCRGSYTTDVRYDVGTRQPGTIRVYEVSAKDGSPLHIVEIPVMLTP